MKLNIVYVGRRCGISSMRTQMLIEALRSLGHTVTVEEEKVKARTVVIPPAVIDFFPPELPDVLAKFPNYSSEKKRAPVAQWKLNKRMHSKRR